MYVSARARKQESPVDPPLKYQLLEIASEMNQRGLNISYMDLLYMPGYILQDYLDMRQIEDEYGRPPET